MEKETLNVSITAEDIDQGKQGLSVLCPVTLAFGRMFDGYLITTGIDKVLMFYIGDKKVEEVIPDEDFEDKTITEIMSFEERNTDNDQRWILPLEAIKFISRFDLGEEVQPLTFVAERAVPMEVSTDEG